MKITFAQKKHTLNASKILVEAYYDTLKSAKQVIKRKISSKEVLLALEGETVVGVLIFTKDYSHYANYIEDIVVSNGHRRKGISQKLLARYVKISRKQQPKKQKWALSSTNVKNNASIKMHKKFGFKVLGIVKKLHYGTDEIIFGYRLWQ